MIGLEQLQSFWAAAALRRYATVGKDLHLVGRPWIMSPPGGIRIGHRLYLSSKPVTSHFAVGPDAVLEIGDDVSIGYGAGIAAFERVRIGSCTRIGPFVIIMDTNFHGASGDQSVQHDCRPVIIGEGCRIGSRVTITRGATIGDGAEVLAGSVVSSAIPAGACAGGARARVLGKAGDPSAQWDGARLILQELIVDICGLDDLPDSDVRLQDLPEWSPARAGQLAAAAAQRLNVNVDRVTMVGTERVGDLATALEIARRARPSR